MMKKEICLADITTLTLNEKIYGHFYSVASQYNTLFQNDEFNVLGGSTYGHYKEFENAGFIKLPFYVNKDSNCRGSKFIKELINAIICVNYKCDSLIFQS